MPSFSLLLLFAGLLVACDGFLNHFSRSPSPKARPALVDNITNVHVVFTNHVDIGYNGIPEVGFIANVLNTYFDVYYPRALNTSATYEALGLNSTYIYLTQSWLLSLYFDCPPGLGLHCPNESSQAALAEGIQKGWITWHAVPFNLEPEVFARRSSWLAPPTNSAAQFMDPSLFSFGVIMTHLLDAQFGQPPKRCMSLRDVPSPTRGIVPLLVANGAAGLTIGTNAGVAPPAVPRAFVWEDPPSGTSIIAMEHPCGYGGITLEDCVIVPGLPDALAFAFRTDNSGPHTFEEAQAVYAQLEAEFPGANVFASTYDRYLAVLETVRDTLPKYQLEFGDTWVYGVPSDPAKVTTYREVARARAECLESGVCSLNDYNMVNMSRFLIKIPEHTWGLPGVGDNSFWSNAQLQSVLNTTNYLNASQAWLEQRLYVTHAVNALPPTHPLRVDIEQRLAMLEPQWPDLQNYTRVSSMQQEFKCGKNAAIAFDGMTGGISLLRVYDKSGKHRDFADSDNLFAQMVYDTFSEEDTTAWYYDYYMYCIDEGGAFIKYNSSSAAPETLKWTPNMTALWYRAHSSSNECDFEIALSMPAETWTKYGAPTVVWLHVKLASDYAATNLSIDLTWWNKTATRLAEASWLTFNPLLTGKRGSWWMDKLGTWFSPFEVILNGSQHQHGIWHGILYSDEQSTVRIDSKDATVVSPGVATPFPGPLTPISNVTGGFSFSLFNNAWNTNYILFYPYLQGGQDRNQKFRFDVTISPSK